MLDGGKATDGPLARGASVLIVRGDVHKVALVEPTLGLAAGGLRLGYQRRDAGLLAVENLFAFEVAAIRKDSELFGSTTLVRGAVMCVSPAA